MTAVWPALRLLVAALGLAAILRQLTLTIANAFAAGTSWGGHVPTVVVNFFSYFTILSNLSAAIILVIAGIRALRTRRDGGPDPAWLATALVCVSTYMIVTGVVYNLLLRSIPIAGLSDVWTNETLHLVVPLFLLADVLLAPRRRALPWSTLAVAAAFPIVWALYTMLRANLVVAPLTGEPWWYPYPFLDPHLVPGGYLGVAGYVLGIAVLVVAVAAGVTWVGRRRGGHVGSLRPFRSGAQAS